MKKMHTTIIFLFLSILSLINAELQLESYEFKDITEGQDAAKGGVERWYFRRSDGICVNFTFHKYALSLNVFENKEKCLNHLKFKAEEKLKQCNNVNVVSEKLTNANEEDNFDPKRTPCYGLNMFRYTHKAGAQAGQPGKCEKFVFQGCGGTANIFENPTECLEMCEPDLPNRGNSQDCNFTPTLPQDSEDLVNTVIADPTHMQCVRAAVASSQVRGKFSTLSHCRKTCFPNAGLANRRCNYFPKQGLCIGKTVKKYYFDQDFAQCLPYQTKDCVHEDMINSFDTFEDCIGSCPADDYSNDSVQGWPEAEEMCHQAKNSGTGTMDITAWYYDFHTQKCHPFIYTGLKGNDNRFESRELCLAACSGKPVTKIHAFETHIINDEVETFIPDDTDSNEDFIIAPNQYPQQD